MAVHNCQSVDKTALQMYNCAMVSKVGKLESYIGTQISLLRKSRALSQEDLAGRVSVSYQQIQKYEKGLTRISISRLYSLAQALDVPLSALLPDSTEPETAPLTGGYSLTADEVKLLKLYRQVSTERMKKIVHDYLRTVNES